ncbi:hypothetical protein CsatB_026380 [Cannabis sativa]|uniref:C2H2-type domain-containing protein n=1 Tax=Cannabis sativa TaxID=3483 RepID=A0A7J6F547_CANSA|nr:hypothetical protein F8388_003464 [Cannabis sativa]KAF4380492.1 hypothetical protein G4B88_011738 [Cannabis sativa]
MEPNKQGSDTTTSSEENDNSGVVSRSVDESGNGGGGGKRSYECTYCKRGFTNAQALGGHMNIHRKDRAKAKQQNPTFTTTCSNNYQAEMGLAGNSPFTTTFSANRSAAAWTSSSTHPQQPPSHHHGMYYQPSHDIYGGPVNYGHYNINHEFGLRGINGHDPSNLGLNHEDDLGNLSLRMNSGSSYLEDDQRSTSCEDDVDLELRLGHRHD